MSGRGVRGTSLLAVGLLALVAPPSVHAAREQTLTLTAALGAAYDDNILEYSDPQLRDFESGAHPDRYSLDTRDDVVYAPSVAMGWELDSGGGRRHALRVRGDGNIHDRNPTADFRSLGAGWRETFRRDRRLSLGYYFIPRYYLRQLADEDVTLVYSGLSRYRRAEFSLQIGSASWSQRAGRSTQLGVGYQFEHRDYRPDFDERDSNLHEGRLTLAQGRLPHRSAASLQAAYRRSKARGSDPDDMPGVGADDPDVSYHGFSIEGAGRTELGRLGAWRWGGDLDYEFEKRFYESTRATDRYHNGRDDSRHTLEVGVRLGYRPHWAVRGFYRLENQAAHLGPAAVTTTEAGSHRRNQAGLAIEWSLSRHLAGAAAEESNGD